MFNFLTAPVPTKDPHPYLNDATAGGNSTGYGMLGDISSQVADGIQKGIANTLVWIIEKSTPFVCFGCKITIVTAIVVYYCSKDKRCITAGVRALFIFLTMLMLDWYCHQ